MIESNRRFVGIEPLMNVDEVCTVLGCKKSKLYVLMQNGYLESVKVGASRLFRPTAVRDCIERHVDRRGGRRRAR